MSSCFLAHPPLCVTAVTQQHLNWIYATPLGWLEVVLVHLGGFDATRNANTDVHAHTITLTLRYLGFIVTLTGESTATMNTGMIKTHKIIFKSKIKL